MKLVNNNILIERIKTDGIENILLSDSECTPTSMARVKNVDENGSGAFKIGDHVCVYKHSGVELHGLGDGHVVVPAKDVLFKQDDEVVTMNGTRLLVEKLKQTQKETDIIFEETDEKTLGLVMASGCDNVVAGDNVCFGAFSGVTIAMPDGTKLMVFDISEILFKYNDER